MNDEIPCTCKCAPDEHGPHGCKTWYGDRNSGFGCNCDWRPVKPLRSTHKDRIALNCGWQIIELLKKHAETGYVLRDFMAPGREEEIRQEIAQIILKNGFEKL